MAWLTVWLYVLETVLILRSELRVVVLTPKDGRRSMVDLYLWALPAKYRDQVFKVSVDSLDMVKVIHHIEPTGALSRGGNSIYNMIF